MGLINDSTIEELEFARRELESVLEPADPIIAVEQEDDGEVKAKMINEMSDGERSNYYRTHPDMEDGDSYRDNLEDR